MCIWDMNLNWNLSMRSLLYLSIEIRNVEIITPILIQETPLDMIAPTISKLYGGETKLKD